MNKNIKKYMPLLVIASFISFAHASDLRIDNIDQKSQNSTKIIGSIESHTVFETGHPYANNAYVTQELSIADATRLRVTVIGEVEANYDKITITDASGTETVYTGVLDEDFIVEGNGITVRFMSDRSGDKDGAVVTIEAIDTPTPPPTSDTTFETGHPYDNAAYVTKELTIADATRLRVSITGELEGSYDKITITDVSGTETVYTGVLDEDFIVEGNGITVRFMSDRSGVENGAIVTIEDANITI